MIVSPEFVPFGGPIYSALVRFNDNAFMVVHDSAGLASRRPTLNFYCLILLGVKMQPSLKDQRRVLQLLMNFDVTSVHEVLLRPRPLRSKAAVKSNAPAKPRKITHRRSAAVNSLEDLFAKLKVDGSPLGCRPGHRRSATTASLEECLAGLRIKVPDETSTATNTSSSETETSPVRSTSGSVSSSTSHRDCNDYFTGSSGDGAASDTSENDSEIKQEGDGKSQGGDKSEEHSKNDGSGNDNAAAKHTPEGIPQDTNGNNGFTPNSPAKPPPTPEMSCANCKRSTHTICWKCSFCEERGGSFFQVWGSHTVDKCSFNPDASIRRSKRKQAEYDARVAGWAEAAAKKERIDKDYAVLFGRPRN
jgi:hypothetical protein